MKNYLSVFREMVRFLEAHPKVIVEYFNIFPPVSQTIIKTIEEKIGHKISTDFKDFFSICNGLELGWKFKLEYTPKSMSQRHLYSTIKIPSLEALFDTSSLDTLVFDAFSLEEQIRIKPFLSNYQWQLYLQSPAQSTDLVTYLSFLIASHGSIQARSTFFNSLDRLKPAQWQSVWNIDLMALHHFFPQSNEVGGSTSSLKTANMQQNAEKAIRYTPTQLDEIVEKHHHFLSTGGAGGRWKTFHVSGLIFGVYTGAKSSEGQQANFEQKRLSDSSLDTIGLLLPFTNFCALYGKYQDFSEADLRYSLFTDAMLEKAIFADANLEYCDFSRANLRGVSFMNANLKGVDFENCDLTGADFRGANWKGAKFPGAILDKIIY